MRIQYIITATALAAVTAAKPHHLHRRAHTHGSLKRGTIFAPAAVETEIVYWLDDHEISEQEVNQGITRPTDQAGLHSANARSIKFARRVGEKADPLRFHLHCGGNLGVAGRLDL